MMNTINIMIVEDEAPARKMVSHAVRNKIGRAHV